MVAESFLADTNILIYRLDYRFPEKQATARALLRRGIETRTLRIAHQSLIEFIAAASKAPRGGEPLLTSEETIREVEEMLRATDVLYPNESVVRTALRGMAAYGLSWFDAHLWAYAETYGIPTLVSEDFQDGRRYGTVTVSNPFLNR